MSLRPHRYSPARHNGFLGIPLSAAERHARATKKLTESKSKYLLCKQEQLNKGKTPYPEDPKGPCKTHWKGWQRWRGKAGERAMKLAEEAERRGAFDPELQAALSADMASAMVENPGAVSAAVVAEGGDVTATAGDTAASPLFYAAVGLGGLTALGVGGFAIRHFLRR